MTELRTKARFTAAGNSRSSDDMPRPVLAYAALLAVVAAYGLHALFISGPAMRETAKAQLEEAIAKEDRDVCAQFGIRPETAQFNVCSFELSIVRQKQVDRDNAAAQGVL